jgi:uncharacterized 2Fe-2S/4Fe-4S cluster protein (DUF4445 family)
MDTEIKVTFLPEGKDVFVLPGTTIQEAASRLEIILEAPCSGQGTCGKCKVRVIAGVNPPSAEEKKLLNAAEIAAGVRLACQFKITGPCTVEVGAAVRLHNLRILTGTHEHVKEIDPATTKRVFHLAEATLKDATSDLDRLLALWPEPRPVPEHAVMQQLPDFLRTHNFTGTAATVNHRLICLEPGDTTAHRYGVALDVGTTTLAAALVDLSNSATLATSARLNPQTRLGDDVISRIELTRQDPARTTELHRLLIDETNRMLAELAASARIDPAYIYEMTVAGNSVMQHLFLNISPAHLGVMPFPLAIKDAVTVRPHELGLALAPAGQVWVFPHIAGFVGGDTVAGILASEMYQADETQLLIDIGTNGEIVMGNRHRLVAASTAAGPAFEGARISQGMRGSAGAIEEVTRHADDIAVNVIGNVLPRGICGSGLIDAVAQLRRVGLLDETGLLAAIEDAPVTVSEKISARLEAGGQGPQFRLTPEVALTQRDIREVQLGKGAIAAGVSILAGELGFKEQELSAVFMAGGFGNFIRRQNALAIGLVPRVLPERVRYIGNAALAGAKLALLSGAVKQLVRAIARSTGSVELSLHPRFQELFADSMMFPPEV